MSTPGPSLHASILSRLKNISRERREDMQFTLARYTCERLLYRLSRSQHADSFVLKGAALFATWVDSRYRATRDIDFLVFIEATEQRIADAFRDIFAVTVEPDDGLLFDADSIEVSRIREEFEYGGLHLDSVARLGTTRIPVKVDSGFVDVITPAAVALTYPSMLGFPAATLRGYPKETVAAEKLEAIVRIGMTNSRLKDYFDLHLLARGFDFDATTLGKAIKATFERRGTAIPNGTPSGLKAAFGNDAENINRWKGFYAKSGIDEIVPLPEVVAMVDGFASPIFARLAAGDALTAKWHCASARWG